MTRCEGDDDGKRVDALLEIVAGGLAEVGLGWSKARNAPKTFALMTSVLWGESTQGTLAMEAR